MVSRFLSIAVALGLTAGMFAACGDSGDSGEEPAADVEVPAACTPEDTAANYPDVAGETLTVAVSPLSPPYISAEEDNPDEIIGFEADLMDAWSACLGVDYEWLTFQDFGAMVPAVQSGRADIVQSSIFATAERAEQIDFVVYMGSFTGSIVQEGNPEGLQSLDDLCGQQVVEVVGAVEVPIVEEQAAKCEADGAPALELSTVKDNNLALQQVQVGRAEIWLVDQGLAAILAETFADELDTGFAIDSGLQIGTGVNKDLTQLRDAIEETLTILQAEGTIAELLVKWGLREEQEIPVAVVP